MGGHSGGPKRVVEVEAIASKLPSEVAEDLSDLPDDPLEWRLWAWGEAGGPPGLVRRLDDQRYVAILPLMYTYAVVTGLISDVRYGYADRWCYHTLPDAMIAATMWDGEGEPEGWHRHPTSGRRRPDGDPAREYVVP